MGIASINWGAGRDFFMFISILFLFFIIDSVNIYASL